MLHHSCSYLPGSKYLMEWHNQTINQPRGVSEQSCMWIVSTGHIYHRVLLWYITFSSHCHNNGVIIHICIMFLSKYASSKWTPHWRLQGANMLTRTCYASESVTFCLCCNFTTVPLTLRCPVTHDLYKSTVHWSALQTIFISALLMRSGQNILMEKVWDGVFLKSSATLRGAT